MSKNIKSVLSNEFLKMVKASAGRMSEKKPAMFDSQTYSDRVKLMVFAQDSLSKPSFYAATEPEPRLACSAFHADMEAFIDEMSQQNKGHNWDGLYGPKTIATDSLLGLNKVAGAEYKNRLAIWVDAQAATHAGANLAQA